MITIPITLYGRYFFEDNSTKYICWYQNTKQLAHLNEPDINATLIFEKAINPVWGPHGYVCIKCFDQYRKNIYSQ